MKSNKQIKYTFTIFILISIVFSIEFTNYQFEIFSIPGDPVSHSLGGISNSSSISLNDIYTLNETIKKGKTLFSYGNLYSNRIDYFQISHILRSTNKSIVGVSLIHKSISDIPYTQDAWVDLGQNITLGEINYESITYYDDEQIGFILLYSISFKKDYSLGIKIKPFYTSIYSYSSIGFTMDVSINRRLNDNLSIASSIKDILSINRWSNGRTYSIIPRFCILGRYKIKKHSLLNEVIFVNSKDDFISLYDYRIGYQNKIYKSMEIRFGYSFIKSLSIGVGFTNKNKTFSYSFNPNLNNIILGHEHQFSILLDLPQITN